MNDVQENKNTMYLSVEEHLTEHATDYASHPKIAPALVQLSSLIVQISTADADAIVDNAGVTQDKEEERIDLEKICFKVANALNSYGRNTGNRKLEKVSKYTMSELEKMRDGDLNTTASLLLKEATPIIALLVNDRLVPADLTQLETERTEFLAMLAKPRHAQIEKTVAGSEVDRLMDQTDSLLKDIDGYVETYRFENPSLWQEYFLARAIVDTGSGGGGGGGESEVVFSGTVPPMSSEVKGPLVYNAATPVALQNNSSVTLGFQLQMSGISSGMIVNVPPMSTQNTTLGAMGANGNELRINNSDMMQSAAYTITLG